MTYIPVSQGTHAGHTQGHQADELKLVAQI